MKCRLIVVYMFFVCNAFCQSFSIKPKIILNSSFFCYQKKTDIKEVDFKPGRFWINPSVGASLIYTNKLGEEHSLNFDGGILGASFFITDKFTQQEPYGPGSISFGQWRFVAHGITPLIIGYQYTKKIKNFNFFGMKKNVFALSLGVAYGLNKSKAYYNEVIPRIENLGFIAGKIYYQYKQNGIFLTSGIRYIRVNKNKRPLFEIELFFNLGFRQMMFNTVSYSYSSRTAPSQNRIVLGQPVRDKGTALGIKVGVPIKLFSLKK